MKTPDSSQHGVSADSDSPEDSALQKRRPKRRLGFRVAAVALAVLPFLLLEGGLRLFGVGADLADPDLHGGYNEATQLFEVVNNDDGVAARKTRLARQRFFVEQQFPVEKDSNEFRVFVLGGSTVQGRPYSVETSFAAWLQILLNSAAENRTVRVINCGGVSYASYRLKSVLKEVVNYDPDLIVLATGHNEFLEDRTFAAERDKSTFTKAFDSAARSSRTVMVLRRMAGYEAPEEPTEETEGGTVEARLDNPAGYASYQRDPEWHDAVSRQFAESLDDMAESCKAADVPLMLVKLGCNRRDCAPFKSQHRKDLSIEDEQAWQLLADSGKEMGDVDAEVGLAAYRQALEIDDQFALLHFRMARCLDRLGKTEEARTFYDAAVELDVCPLRMPASIATQMQQAAERHQLTLVDAEGRLQAAHRDGLPGFNAYIDHVHPTIGGHQQIAVELAKNVCTTDFGFSGTLPDQSIRRRLFAAHMASLPANYASNGRRRIGWLEGWAQKQRLAGEVWSDTLRASVAISARHLDLDRTDDAANEMIVALTGYGDLASAEMRRQAFQRFTEGRYAAADWLLNQLTLFGMQDHEADQIALAQLALAVEQRDEEAFEVLYRKLNSRLEAIKSQDDLGWKHVLPGN